MSTNVSNWKNISQLLDCIQILILLNTTLAAMTTRRSLLLKIEQEMTRRINISHLPPIVGGQVDKVQTSTSEGIISGPIHSIESQVTTKKKQLESPKLSSHTACPETMLKIVYPPFSTTACIRYRKIP